MGKEIIVPLAVVGVLASMLLPVAPGFMDFLLVANLILALVLLISTLYITDSLKLSSLPSMLLLATLYRLALNISTTRNILSSGEAGRVVEAFGNVVIQGNLVVGVVIFLIITLVQFIVIAKGSERVAEVSARFTLDALPGKQMSIDADVRAGLIDFNTARIKRQDLQTESRFYGALDGAMKFIKGDAICGMVITAINIIGGFAIGIFGDGLELGEATSKYTILTVGDGLVAQIPALLNSLAAGIIVTRVGRGDDSSLASELIRQIGQLRQVKIIIGIFAIGLGFIPGMPGLPFISLATVLLLSACFGLEGNKEQSQEVISFVPKPVPLLQFQVESDAARELLKSKELMNIVEEARQTIYDRLGLILPFPDLVTDSAAGRSVSIKIRGISASTLSVPRELRDALKLLKETLIETLLLRASDLIDDVLTRRTLDNLDAQAPELVSSVVPGVIGITQLTEILKALVREGISIKNFDQILQAVSEHGPKAANERVLLEEVRIALKWVITDKFKGKSQSLSCFVLDPVLDMSLTKAEREKGLVDLEAISTISNFLKQNRESASVIVISRGARRLLSEYLKMRGENFPVIAFEELAEGVNLDVVEHIDIGEETKGELVDKLAA